jgi:hypothetical protein
MMDAKASVECALASKIHLLTTAFVADFEGARSPMFTQLQPLVRRSTPNQSTTQQ